MTIGFRKFTLRADSHRTFSSVLEVCKKLVILILLLPLGFVSPLWGQSNPVQYIYDPLGRLIRVVDPSGNVATYNYDAVGNLLSITRSTLSTTALAILNFSPTQGPVGQTVTIQGQNFATTTTPRYAVSHKGYYTSGILGRSLPINRHDKRRVYEPPVLFNAAVESGISKEPDQMSNRTIKTQVIDGLRLTAKTILAICTGMALVGGVVMTRTPSPHPGSLLARHPAIPWVCIAIATVILVLTTDRWVKILPGILAYGVLGGLIMFAAGHYNKVHVGRLTSLLLTLFMALAAALTLSFARRRLNWLDRIVLVAFAFCIAFSVTPNFSAMIKALSIGLALLLFGWAFNRARHQGRHGSSQGPGGGTEQGSMTHKGALTSVILLLILVCVPHGLAQSANSIQYVYDALGRLSKVVDPNGNVATYNYDAVGNLLSITRSTLSTTAPAILSFSPTQGPVGQTVTIQGQNFATTTSGNSVKFNGTAATVTAASANSLTVSVPTGATTGPITVTVGSSTATSSTNFTVLTVPVITSISPTLGLAGSNISNFQVTGSNLTAATFAFLPTFSPLAVTPSNVNIGSGGTSATMTLTLTAGAVGSFTLAATNSSGTSTAASSASNTLTIISSDPSADSDGDGLTNLYESAISSNPTNPSTTNVFRLPTSSRKP